jgi:bacterioferritin (cytochrome b1)
MPDPTALLRTELTTLLRLTQTEAAIAQARRAQAASAEINQELAQNAANCNERADLLAEQIARLGGVPDVLGGALGRVSAFAKLQLDQTQSFPEALLGDLALERQLLDRTRFAKALAQAASEDDVLDILDRLEVAHTATVDWLHLRLAEVAVGGPVALRPTPVQAALSSAQAVAGIPAVQANKLVNRFIALANRLRGRAVESTKSTVDRTVESTKSTVDRTVESTKSTLNRGTELASAGASVVTAGRDAMLNRGETVAREQGAASLADSVHAVREDLGIVAASDLPIKSYDNLSGDAVMAKLGEMDDPEEIRTVIAFETAHKNRKGVLKAAESRIEDIARELASTDA